MYKLFRSLNPTSVYLLVLGVFFVSIVCRFLFKSLYGAFFLALACYFSCEYVFGVAPLTFSELIVFVYELDPQYKVGVLTSVITVVGFLFAFRASGESFLMQVREEQKIKAANEIEEFAVRVQNASYVVERYAEDLDGLEIELRKNTPTEEVLFRVRQIQRRTEEFEKSKSEISRLSVEVHRLMCRHANVLSSGLGLKKTADHVVLSIKEISDAMWFLTPLPGLNEEQWLMVFKAKSDQVRRTEFLRVVQLAQATIASGAGAIKGGLYAKVWGLTGVGLIGWLNSGKDILGSFRELKNKQ